MPTERVRAIRMSAFRGIREILDLDLGDGRSLLVLGRNATGKSSIADALEWHLNGGIELLQHEGRQQDVRHAGASDGTPTFVRITTSGALNGETWLDNTLGPGPSGRAAGETWLLRGRTLSDFVNLTKGDKWKRLASLLGLEAVDQLRLDMQATSNKLEQELETARQHLSGYAKSLKPLWEGETHDGLWEAIRDASQMAGVEEPASLNHALDPSWSSALASKDPTSDRPKAIERVAIALAEAPELTIHTEAWNAALEVLHHPSSAELSLLKAAEIVLSGAEPATTCPLCQQAVDHETLAANVVERLSGLLEDAKAWDEASSHSAAVIRHVEEALARRQAVVELATKAALTIPKLPLEHLARLMELVQQRHELDEADALDVQTALAGWDEAVRSAVEADPAADVDKLSPVVRLVLLLERGRVWRDAVVGESRASIAAERAASLFKVISDRQSQLVGEILSAISDPLAEIYSALHPDESLDSAAVEQWGDKGLELAVEFHGEKRRPPHGVLSESHLNSLAIAVFLAMAEIFNDEIGFLVLDDVVSSFDLEHRAKLAELLVERYQDWQLIVLTHDRLFFERIRRLGPGWETLEFTSWDFNDGPRFSSYATTDHIARARAAVDDGDVPNAATATRRALEESLQEACEGFGAPLPFRRGYRNDQREAQEVIDGLRRRAKSLDASTRTIIRSAMGAFEADLQAALNPEAHASQEWAAMAEVREALDRVATFVDWFICGHCSSPVWRNWTGTAGSCQCGGLRIPPLTAD